MKPARADRPIDPPAVDPLAIYISEMSDMRSHMRQLQADVFRLMASVVRDKNAGAATDVAAPPLETDAAKIARLQGANTVLGKLAITVGLLKALTVSDYLSVKEAAYRFGCGDERMRQLVKSGAVVSRRIGGGPISILRASVDALLLLLRREPRE